MILVKDILTPREEVLSGNFRGVIRSHKVDTEEKGLENDSEELFKITFLSTALKRAIELINEKAIGKSNQGAFLLAGPYGAGKTHGLITLYHLFKNPESAKDWLNTEWKVDLKIPFNTKTCMISTRRYDKDLIWEPIFQKLGRDDLLPQIRRFPTTDQIEELIDSNPTAIFIDEIENWYGSFDPATQSDLIERNETFLEHLFEVANDPSKNLFVFITFLGEKSGLKKIFNRTKPITLDVSIIDDRKKIILHRLFENSTKKNSEKIEKIINSYIDKYKEPIEIENISTYKQKMFDTYPFHPLLFECLTQIYEAAAERQDIRGMMNILADVVKDYYDKSDIFLISDLEESSFRGIDLRLVEKYNYDIDRVKDISYGKEILKTVLVFTLNDKTKGCSKSDILLSIFKPTQGHSINSLFMDIENIYGKAHYLHKIGSIYIYKHDLEIYALIEKEKKNIKEEAISRKIAELVKLKVFDNRAFIYGFEDIPDDSKFKIVTSLDSFSDLNVLVENLETFYRGKTWQNVSVFIFPNNGNIIENYEINEKIKRILAAERLQSQVEDGEKKIQKILEDENVQITTKLKALFGRILRWVADGDKLTPRLINIIPDISTIREKACSDTGIVEEHILESVKDKAEGERLEFLINDFKKLRKYPVILSDEDVFRAVRILHKDKRVIVQGDRGKWYIDEIPRNLEYNFSIFDPKFAPEKEIEPIDGKEKPDDEITEQGDFIGRNEGDPERPIVDRRNKVILNEEGNSIRNIVSKIENKTNEYDAFTDIKLKYEFAKEISKQDIMKFLKSFPAPDVLTESIISAEISLWRKNES